jgi:hypothetical protein
MYSLFVARCLRIAESSFPFYACTLRFLVPRCCRVPLQPWLIGQNGVSFSGLQGAETFVYKPDCNVKPTAQRGLEMKSGAKFPKNHKAFISNK